jgi:hypothetical protein
METILQKRLVFLASDKRLTYYIEQYRFLVWQKRVPEVYFEFSAGVNSKQSPVWRDRPKKT